MRGIVFCTSPIVFQAESTKTHLEETLHINSLYHNLDPGSYESIYIYIYRLKSIEMWGSYRSFYFDSGIQNDFKMFKIRWFALFERTLVLAFQFMEL